MTEIINLKKENMDVQPHYDYLSLNGEELQEQFNFLEKTYNIKMDDVPNLPIPVSLLLLASCLFQIL